jgi:UDP-N-acetylglucosamine 4,6-dehydratase/5-epimerase
MKKTMLITGGTGFLGRQLAQTLRDQYQIVLASRNNKQNQLAAERTGARVMPLDVASIESVRDVVVEVRPDVIVHAAATKFVDLSEKFPMECVDVNVVGSQNVARVAVDKGVKVVVGISTDKAAPPVRNTYGLSKAIMERLFCSMNTKADTRFACVRYGNVAWSTGSVLPIWKKMHADTGVIRSTGPHMRRFFFTIDEAVALVRTCLDNMDLLAGRVLSRTMKAAQISDLLNTWVEAKGGRWEKMEGRPGERDDEFLIGDLELPYTVEKDFDGVKHFIITFNEKAPVALPVGLSSANTERLTKAEMLQLIEMQAE